MTVREVITAAEDLLGAVHDLAIPHLPEGGSRICELGKRPVGWCASGEGCDETTAVARKYDWTMHFGGNLTDPRVTIYYR